MKLYCEFCGIIANDVKNERTCPKCETVMFYVPDVIAKQARAGFLLEQRKKAEKNRAKRIIRDNSEANKNAAKLHYPRFAGKSVCGFKESDKRLALEKIADFFATTPEHRCAKCLEIIKSNGYNVSELVNNYGGKL